MHAITRRPVVPLLVAAMLVVACGGGATPIGSLPTNPITPEPSIDIPSPEPTPGPTASSTAEPSTPTPTGTPVETASPTVAPSATPSPGPGETTIVRVYLLLEDPSGGDATLVPVLREVPATKAVATAAMRELLGGLTDVEAAASPRLFTTVPEGVSLLGLAISDRIATVDLSREFESGGGSASILGRLAQVVYTLTQFSTVDSVRFKLDGEIVTVFGGEGVVLDGPVGRADYREQLPEIFVDRPAWRAALGNPGRITGLTRVFEAQFLVQVRDAAGRVLVEEPVMASCGTGCWGTFDVRVGYAVATAQWGTLRVFDRSARDGTPENVRDYPVWLTPAS